MTAAASIGASLAVRDRAVRAGLTSTTYFRRSPAFGWGSVEAVALHQGRTQQNSQAGSHAGAVRWVFVTAG